MKSGDAANATRTQSAILRRLTWSACTTSTSWLTPKHASPSRTRQQVLEEQERHTWTLRQQCADESFSLSDMNNNRYQCLRFSVSCNTVLHGFAGYFETTLYKDVTLSKSSPQRPRVLSKVRVYIRGVCGRYKTGHALARDVLLVPHPLPSEGKLQ